VERERARRERERSMWGEEAERGDRVRGLEVERARKQHAIEIRSFAPLLGGEKSPLSGISIPFSVTWPPAATIFFHF